jgi:hypothetical protein
METKLQERLNKHCCWKVQFIPKPKKVKLFFCWGDHLKFISQDIIENAYVPLLSYIAPKIE